METVLRAADPADIPALAALGRDSFVAKFGDLYRPEDLGAFLADTHSETAVAAELADPRRLYRLAERDGRLVGYCKLGIPSGFPEHARGRNPIEIKQLYTAPDAVGGGIGKAFMAWVLEEAARRGADEIQLSVYSDNVDAQRFYARHGFDKVADIHFWVGEKRDDEFLFARMV
jgi:ribosomal protein S18 acetylase RimI-like enzyme